MKKKILKAYFSMKPAKKSRGKFEFEFWPLRQCWANSNLIFPPRRLQIFWQVIFFKYGKVLKFLWSASKLFQFSWEIFIFRQFLRKYTLPRDCKQDMVASNLSSDGVLVITAPKIQQITDNAGRSVPIMRSWIISINLKWKYFNLVILWPNSLLRYIRSEQ